MIAGGVQWQNIDALLKMHQQSLKQVRNKERRVKYYSEDTVRRIIRIVAHTALEQLSLYADNVLQKQPSIEIKEPHGRLVDADQLKQKTQSWTIGRRDDFYSLVINANATIKAILDSAPTVLEASK